MEILAEEEYAYLEDTFNRLSQEFYDLISNLEDAQKCQKIKHEIHNVITFIQYRKSAAKDIAADTFTYLGWLHFQLRDVIS